MPVVKRTKALPLGLSDRFPPNRFTMLRVYIGANAPRLVHEEGLTFDACRDLRRFPAGTLTDSRGSYRYTYVLTDCLKPENYHH